MSRADEYKYLAARVLEAARNEQSLVVKAGWKSLAESYLRLAEQCEKEPQKPDGILDPKRKRER